MAAIIRRLVWMLPLLAFFVALVTPSTVDASPTAQATDLCGDASLTQNGRVMQSTTLVPGRYIADCSIAVQPGVSMTLTSGTTIEFTDRGDLSVLGGARLFVNGINPGDIVLTSDDTVKAPGQWRGLRVLDGARATITGANIRYGGIRGAAMLDIDGHLTIDASTVLDGEGQGILIDRVDATIRNVRIERHAKDGIEIVEHRDRTINVVIEDSTINGSTGAAVKSGSTVQLSLSNNSAHGNGVNGIALASGNMTRDIVWRGGDLPYAVIGRQSLRATLTIEPNTIVKFETGGGLRAEAGGRIVTASTADSPAILTTITDDEACLFTGPEPRISCDTGNDGNKANVRGSWDKIEFTSGSEGGFLQHVEIRFGRNRMVDIGTAGVHIQAASIATSAGTAVHIDAREVGQAGPFSVISDTVIADNPENGLQFSSTVPNTIELRNNRFADNGKAVSVAADIELDVSGNESQGAGLNGYHITGHMTVPHRWVAGDMPFMPAGRIELREAGAELTVEAGAVVKSLASGSIDVSRGRLIAGAPGGPRTLFTTAEDDACSAEIDEGCDSNGDGNATSPDAGDWRQILIGERSRGALLQNIEIRYGGSKTSDEAQLKIMASGSTVTGSIIRHGNADGILLDSAQQVVIEGNEIHSNGSGTFGGSGIRVVSGALQLAVGFRNNHIYNNNGGAIEIDANVELNMDGSNRTDEPEGFVGDPVQTQLNGIVVAGTQTQNLAWRKGALPYIVVGTVSIQSSSTLTIEPGVVVKFDTGGNFAVGSGSLVANGEAGNEILFTSVADTTCGAGTPNTAICVAKHGAGAPGPGDWPGLEFRKPGVEGRTVTLEHVELRYAGRGNKPAVLIEQNRTRVVNSIISDAAGIGILINDADAVEIISSHLEQIRGDGIRAQTSQGLIVTIRETEIRRAANAVSMTGNVQPVLSGNIVADNAINGIVVDGNVTLRRTWPSGDLIYVLARTVKIDRGTLTIDPGAVVKGLLGSELNVTDGNLYIGSADGPMTVLTSVADDDCGPLAEDGAVCNTDNHDVPPLPGDWSGIMLTNRADEARLSNIALRYAGSGTAALDVRMPDRMSVEHSVIEATEKIGISLNGTQNAVVRENHIIDGLGTGIVVQRDSSVVIEGNVFTGNARPLEVFSSRDIETFNNVSVGNLNDAMLYRADVTTSQTWTNDFVREIDGRVQVRNNADLVISPGSLLRFLQRAAIEVRSNQLQAKGVTFAADVAQAEAGHWAGLAFEENSRGFLRHSVLAFSGSSSRGAVHVASDGQGQQIRVEYNTFLRSEGSAITVSKDRVEPPIIGNLIRGVSGSSNFGIRLSDDGTRNQRIAHNHIAGAANGIQLIKRRPNIEFNSLADLTGDGIVNRSTGSTGLCVPAEGNWWGDLRGPKDTNASDRERDPACKLYNPTSNGVGVSEGVDYDPPLPVALPQAPVLDLPRAGFTNRTEITVAGRAGANEEVRMFDADATTPLRTVRAGSDGRFETTVQLTPGNHELSVESFKTVEGFGSEVLSPRVGFRVVDVVPSSIIDPSSIRFIYGPDRGPQVQPLRDGTGASPRCGGPSPGRVVIPEDQEVKVRLETGGSPTRVELVSGDEVVALRPVAGGAWETELITPRPGSFELRADGDEAGACRGFIYIGGAGRVFADTGAPGPPVLESTFETGNDGWAREHPWARVDTGSRGGTWHVADSPGSNYVPGTQAALTLAIDPPLNLRAIAAPEIHFYHHYDFGRGDSGVIEIKTAEDGRWTKIHDFRGQRTNWHDVRIPLDSVAREPRVWIRFRMDANSDEHVGYGWHIDDIVIGPGGANNGVYDEGEPLIAGAQVTLQQRDPQTGAFFNWLGTPTGQFNPQLTDESGRYSFFALPVGEYRLFVEPPVGSGLTPFATDPPMVIVDGTVAIDVPLGTSLPVYLPVTLRQGRLGDR